MSRCSALIVLLLFGLTLTQASIAQPGAPAGPPAAEPDVQPEPRLVLRELLVVQTDRYGDTANNPKLVSTTLFSPMRHQDRTKRTKPDGSYEFVPMPLGLITFEGEPSEPMKLRLTLQNSRDRFHAHWPNNAIVSSQFVQWQQLVVANEQARAVPFAKKRDWLGSIRESDDRLWFQSRGGPSKERFLLYDASFRFKPAIDLTFADHQYILKTRAPEQAAPPMSVLIRKTDAGWAGDSLAAPWPQTTAPIATKPAEAGSASSLPEALTPIKDLLEQRGYSAQEIGLALGMIASAGLDKSAMSLVYVLPVGVIDEHIRLQIKPAPDRLVRTAIVVVNNVDPDLGSQVQALIADLGSDQWVRRDRAQRRLTALGQAAIKQVQSLKNSKDPEVAFRARQILDEYDWKMNGGK